MNNEEIQFESMTLALEEGLLGLAKKHRGLVVLNADFGERLGLNNFSSAFPERIFNFGLAENNMVAASCGFAATGKVPFIVGLSNFCVGRTWEIIRNCICYPNLNVKFIGFGTGILEGEDGVGYQATEDIALTNVLPNMKVICPADYYEARSAINVAFLEFGPVYLRMTDKVLPVIYDENYKFQIGKASVLREGDDVCVFTCGAVISQVLEAVKLLETDGLKAAVVNVSSIKPIDKETILKHASGKKVCFSVEDHSVIFGMGSAVNEVLTENGLKGLRKIGIRDRFAESGKSILLYKKYGLSADEIYVIIKAESLPKSL